MVWEKTRHEHICERINSRECFQITLFNATCIKSCKSITLIRLSTVFWMHEESSYPKERVLWQFYLVPFMHCHLNSLKPKPGLNEFWWKKYKRVALHHVLYSNLCPWSKRNLQLVKGPVQLPQSILLEFQRKRYTRIRSIVKVKGHVLL